MAKFNADTYRPTQDSSLDSNGKRRQFKLAGHVVLVVPHLHCYCGCGRPVVRKEALFVRGHDARLRAKLIRAFITETPTALVLQDADSNWSVPVANSALYVAKYVANVGPHTSGNVDAYWAGQLHRSAAKHAAKAQVKAERDTVAAEVEDEAKAEALV